MAVSPKDVEFFERNEKLPAGSLALAKLEQTIDDFLLRNSDGGRQTKVLLSSFPSLRTVNQVRLRYEAAGWKKVTFVGKPDPHFVFERQ